jgi:glycosyltransferase involved in cell wall biosynthesis
MKLEVSALVRAALPKGSLLAAYHNGSTPEEIAVQYSVLHLEEIYAAIAYYLNHRQEMDNYLEQRRQKSQQQRSEFVQQYNLANLRQRLLDKYS